MNVDAFNCKGRVQMIFKKTKGLLVGLAALISFNVEAKIEQFQESYAGYLPMEFTLDGVTFLGETTFSNGSSTLTLYYEALSQLQDQLYVVFGSYSRNQVQTSQLGQFDFWLSVPDPINPVALPDPAFSDLPIEGSFHYEDILMMPDGQLEVFYSEYGALKGFVSPHNYLTFTIDWTIYTRDRRTLVPAPSSLWLFSSGLLFIGLLELRRKRLPLVSARDTAVSFQ
ncbi:hypothetical protein [Methylophilus sp. 5]|uniref:hypothetical protein n=1 Tax=Methylophilus sp. 5 TaxID=1112274 RepID=UPI00048F4004|nr:hypothetical protein [Methylophilus sp. 5]